MGQMYRIEPKEWEQKPKGVEWNDDLAGAYIYIFFFICKIASHEEEKEEKKKEVETDGQQDGGRLVDPWDFIDRLLFSFPLSVSCRDNRDPLDHLNTDTDTHNGVMCVYFLTGV